MLRKKITFTSASVFMVIVIILSSLGFVPIKGSLTTSITLQGYGIVEDTNVLSLHQDGSEICDQFGHPVHLTGIWANMKTRCWGSSWAVTSEASLDTCENLGIHLIRVRIEMGRFVPGPYTYNDSFFSQPYGLDWLVSECNKRGIYILLNFNVENFGDYFTAVNGGGWPAWWIPAGYYANSEAGALVAWDDFWMERGPFTADNKAQVIDAWRHVVSRYKSATAVLAWGIPCNEPVSWDISESDAKAKFYPFIRSLVDAIRAIDPNRLIVMETMNYCILDPRWDFGKLMDIERENVAVEWHSYYPGSAVYGRSYDPNAPYQSITPPPTVWNKQMMEEYVKNVTEFVYGNINRSLVIGEAGTYLSDPNHLIWYQDLYEILHRYDVWLSTGFYGDRGTGNTALWTDEGTLKDWGEVLKQESSQDVF